MNRALKYTIGFSIISFLIILLVGYVERRTVNQFRSTLPYYALGDHLKGKITESHLWMEELFAGDPSVNFDGQIIPLLNTSRELIQAAYDGKESTLGDFGALDDEETKALLKEALISIEKFQESAVDRMRVHREAMNAVPDSTGALPESVERAGGEYDKKLDAAYGVALARLDAVTVHVKDIVGGRVSYMSTLSWISLVLLVATCSGLAFYLYRLLLGHDRIEKESTKQMARQTQTVSSLTEFVEAISAGNYAVELKMEGDEDLNKTLVTMRDKLQRNAEDERRRSWSTTGLAQIGELLRSSGGNTTELLDNIIKFVVKYTKSNQGGLFVLNEEDENDKHLELMACYAFERKKYLQKKAALGEGLIGQCFLEGERIYLVEVPSEYISITSGLGGSNPNALLLVPLKVNEKIYGVLELATFGNYKDYEIELVEKLAESIASTISTVRVNESTRLLLERTQQQAEEMRAQEEEMRQNMEELEATQEEMRRKEKHIQAMLDGEKERNEISQKNRKVLMDLTKNRDIQSGQWNSALERITATVGSQLHVSRCSVWTINATRNKITSEKLYQSGTRTYESGAELHARDFPGYFEAITQEEIIAAKDAITHSATREFADVYLRPLNIQSMLDVPFFNEGRIAGVICCEHQHEQKEWTEEDIEFLKSCADLVTVSFNTMKINTMIENLNEAQDTLQTIIDNIPRAVFWKDRELRFQGCNKIFAQVAGLKSPRDLIGRTDFDMPWKQHAEAYRADDLAVMNSRKPRLDLEERNVNSAGEESWVLTSKVPVTNQHAEVVAVLGMFEDITDRKRKEADVLAKLKELEELKRMIGNR